MCDTPLCVRCLRGGRMHADPSGSESLLQVKHDTEANAGEPKGTHP